MKRQFYCIPIFSCCRHCHSCCHHMWKKWSSLGGNNTRCWGSELCRVRNWTPQNQPVPLPIVKVEKILKEQPKYISGSVTNEWTIIFRKVSKFNVKIAKQLQLPLALPWKSGYSCLWPVLGYKRSSWKKIISNFCTCQWRKCTCNTAAQWLLSAILKYQSKQLPHHMIYTLILLQK